MSDLQRWSMEDATPEERRLLEASRGERPHPAARARTLLALGIGAPAGGGPASAIGAPTKISPIKLLVLGAGALALGAAIVGGISRERGTADHPQAEAAAQVSARAPSIAAPAVPPVPATETAEAETSKGTPSLAPPPVPPKPARAAHRITRPVRDARAGTPSLEPSLAEEVAALDRARERLAEGHAAAALRSLDDYRARFAHGRLAAEEIRVARASVARARRSRGRRRGRSRVLAGTAGEPVRRAPACTGPRRGRGRAEKVIDARVAGQGVGQEAR